MSPEEINQRRMETFRQRRPGCRCSSCEQPLLTVASWRSSPPSIPSSFPSSRETFVRRFEGTPAEWASGKRRGSSDEQFNR